MNFQKFQNHSVEKLLEDAEFRAWINQSNEIDLNQLESFYQKFPKQKEKFQQAVALYEAINNFDKATSIEYNNNNFTSTLKLKMNTAKAAKQKKVLHKKLLSSLAVAASITLLIGCSLWFFSNQNAKPLSYHTNYGEWKKIDLPDGSKVKLNAKSNLIWIGGKENKVKIEGEAFFEITKKPKGKKFQVITDELIVEVYGTRFNVNSRGKKTQVFLEEGIVNILLEKEEKRLEPGDFISYSKEKKQYTQISNKILSSPSSWKDGILNMQNKSVQEMLIKLEQIYGLEIFTTNDSLLNQVKTFALPIDNLDQVISILEKTLKVNIVKTKQQLILK